MVGQSNERFRSGPYIEEFDIVSILVFVKSDTASGEKLECFHSRSGRELGEYQKLNVDQ
jgi:hypothetical protein